MKLLFYKNNNIEKEISNIIKKNNTYIIQDEDINMNIIIDSELILTRENDEFSFKLIIGLENKCIYKLKKYDLIYDIKVIDASYNILDNKIEINYHIESDDAFNKIEIVNEE